MASKHERMGGRTAVGPGWVDVWVGRVVLAPAASLFSAAAMGCGGVETGRSGPDGAVGQRRRSRDGFWGRGRGVSHSMDE
jgi:hypothetical protein